MMPPALLYLRIRKNRSRPLALWFPLFALWPALIGMVALVLVALPIALLIALPFRYANAVWRFARAIPHLLALFAAMRGFQLEATSSDRTVNVHFV